MNAMLDDAMALSVAEATMQDWLAAVTSIKTAPPSFYQPAPREPDPVFERPLSVRRATPVQSRTLPPPPSRVAGARSGYWFALAISLGLLTVL